MSPLRYWNEVIMFRVGFGGWLYWLPRPKLPRSLSFARHFGGVYIRVVWFRGGQMRRRIERIIDPEDGRIYLDATTRHFGAMLAYGGRKGPP